MWLSMFLTRFASVSKGCVNSVFRPMLTVMLPCLLTAPGLVLGLVLGSVTSVAHAERQLDLYTDTQLVLDQSDQLRQQAMKSSLAAVFIRVTGNAQIAEHATIVQALSEPGTYVSQYRYNSTDEVITIAGASRPAQALWLQFSESAIQRVLQSAQLPVWSSVRPEILLWVAVDESGKRILNVNSTSINTFKRIASTRGLPLAVPLLDLTDREILTAARLWARDEAAIARASLRYGADGVLAGRLLSVSASLLRGNFVLMSGGRSYYFTADGKSKTEVIQKIIDQSVSSLANANAIVAVGDSAAPHIVVAIDNVTNFSVYAELLDTLRNISSVDHAMLQEVNSNHLIVSLRYQGSKATLLRQLSSLPSVDRMPVNQFLQRYQGEQREERKERNVGTTSSESSSNNDAEIAPRIDVAFTWAGSTSR